MPTHNDSQNIYKKMSEENQPLPQTIIKGYLLRTAQWHIGRFKAAPYKSSKSSLAKVPVSSVSRIDIGAFFRFMTKQ